MSITWESLSENTTHSLTTKQVLYHNNSKKKKQNNNKTTKPEKRILKESFIFISKHRENDVPVL